MQKCKIREKTKFLVILEVIRDVFIIFHKCSEVEANLIPENFTVLESLPTIATLMAKWTARGCYVIFHADGYLSDFTNFVP